jgi:RNA polymerase sigma-70 factor (ECF subfamily)
MTRTQRPDSFLTRLNAGESEAIQQVFLRYKEDLCRGLKRRLEHCLRGKLDSEDIVHSLWLRLLPHFRACRWRFDRHEQLRGFLFRSACNHLHNRARRLHLELRYVKDRRPHEPAMTGEEVEEALRTEEFWDHVLLHCPVAHHDLLRLKREGWSLDQLAALKGLHKSSVRRILAETLQRLRAACPAGGPLEPPSRAPAVASFDRLERWTSRQRLVAAAKGQ